MGGNFAAIGMASLLCCLGLAVSAQSYIFSQIDVPTELGAETNPADINDLGPVVGDYFTAEAQPCRGGFLLRDGAFETFVHPEAACSSSSDLDAAVIGVSDAGDIVGIYRSATPRNIDGLAMVLGFPRARSLLVDSAVPGSSETEALGIDGRGRIVGWYSRANDPSRAAHGFLLDEGGYRTVDAPGAQRTWLYRINARGEIVGSHMDSDYVERGFLYRSGGFASLEYAGDAIATFPWGIASNSRVAGYAVGEDCRYVCGFVGERGAFHLLARPERTEAHPAAVDARRVVVGGHIDSDGNWRGFVAKPR
jgi:uncharacterized membrane protein